MFIIRFKFNGYTFGVIFKRKVSLKFKGFIAQFETIEQQKVGSVLK
jgi:hypothetical protein